MSPKQNVPVELADRSYEIEIGTGCLNEVGATAAGWWRQKFNAADSESPRALIITDTNVADHHLKPVEASLASAGWSTRNTVVPAGEETKCVASVERLYDELVGIPADRRTVVIALGGGVIGDLAGFAAATFARGIPFVQIPTTLLAQVDSSVGGKTGVNHPQGKNLIGAFHQPLGVFIDTATLDTLPDRDYRAGMAEVLKYGVIMDEPFFAWLEEHVDQLNARSPQALRHIVKRSCELKARVVTEDERETSGRRAILNYGHTFAHAFEALSDYSKLRHGEAVAIGMAYAGRFAEELERVPSEFNTRQNALIESLKLPITLPQECRFAASDVLDRMKLDKKTVGNKLRFLLPTKIGHVEVVKDCDEASVLKTLDATLRP